MYVPPYREKTKRYCSRACFGKAAAVPIGERECDTCGKVFVLRRTTKSKQYCSVMCIPRGDCLVCGKSVHKNYTLKESSQTCSPECAIVLHRTSKPGTRYIYRGYAATIIRIGKLACERCGCDNIWCLAVHHKDRNRKNNVASNLETLCANCHAIEHYEDTPVREQWVRMATALAQLDQFADTVTE